jgi:hypothetical protein
MLPPILHLNYPLDTALLLQQASEAKESAMPYVDPRSKKLPRDGWKINKFTSSYIKHVVNDLGIIARPRFFWLAPNEILTEHTDIDTLCSVNFLLSSNIAPIIIEGVEYFYKQALLNTQRRHKVRNGSEERILFKMSIFENSYEEIYEKLSKTYGVNN